MNERHKEKVINSFEVEIKKKKIFFKVTLLLVLALLVFICSSKAEEGEGGSQTKTKKQETSKSVPKEEKESEQEIEKKLISTEVNQSYIRFPPFRIPVIQNRIHKSNFMLEIVIEAPDHDKAILLFKNRPRLIHAIIVDLYSLFAVIWYPEFHVELHELKARLLKVCEKIVGNNLIKDILIQKFIAQEAENDILK